MENLHPHEAQMFKEAKETKQAIFTFQGDYDPDLYKDFQDALHTVDTKKNDEERATDFVSLWEEVATSPEAKDKLPAIAAAELFEKSFTFFRDGVTAETKKRLTEMQAQIIAGTKELEMRNIYLGMWGFYADPERRWGTMAATERSNDDEIRDQLAIALEQLKEEEMKKVYAEPNRSHKLLELYSISSADSLRSLHNGDEIRYFAQLYAQDGGKLALEGVPAEEPDEEVDTRTIGKQPKQREHVEYSATSERMPPHTRLYTFENNRLPTPSSIDENAVGFYITDSNQVLVKKANRESDVQAERLPPQLMERFINEMMRVRVSSEYISAGDDPAAQRELRIHAVESFFQELFDPQSALNKRLSQELGKGHANLQSVIEKFAAIERPYVFFSYQVNNELRLADGKHSTHRPRARKKGVAGA